MRSNKFWLSVLGAIVIASSAAALILLQKPATQARIYSDGALIEILDLAVVVEPYFVTVRVSDGINVVAVEPGRIRVSESDCPDGSCVRQGWMSGGVRPLVCLPHRLVIALDGGSAPATDIDAVVG